MEVAEGSDELKVDSLWGRITHKIFDQKRYIGQFEHDKRFEELYVKVKGVQNEYFTVPPMIFLYQLCYMVMCLALDFWIFLS